MNAKVKQLLSFLMFISILHSMYILAIWKRKLNKSIVSANESYPQMTITNTKIQSHISTKNKSKSSITTTKTTTATNIAGISEELLNPKSPFYMMFYKESYGLPLSNQERHNYKEVYHDWRGYFPSLIASIEQSVKENPTRNVKQLTKSAIIDLNKTEFRFGQEFVATITSIDGEGRAKKFGGDYYRARLIRDNTVNPDGIPCRVTDNEDGTYTVIAPLLLEGRLMFDVVLSHSLGTILEVIDQTHTRLCSQNTYVVRLKSGEIVECSFSYDCLQGISVCDYSNPRNNATWICKKPPNDKECQKIVYVQPHSIRESIKKNVELVCNKYGCQLAMKQIELTVTGNREINNNLPFCKDRFNSYDPGASTQNPTNFGPITGFVQDKKWRSLQCRGSDESSSLKFKNCLQNKVIYYLGDSTMRQYFYASTEKLKLKVIKSNLSQSYHEPLVGYDEDNRNITFYYRAHGPPMLNPGPPHTYPFIADTISWIPGGKHVYVVLNVGAHFYSLSPNILIQRLEVIRNSIMRHHTKYPKTKFIVRGYNDIQFRTWAWEWAIYRFEVILRTFFKNIRNVVYLNLWDITTVWPLTENYHPEYTTLNQQWNLMHTFMCD